MSRKQLQIIALALVCFPFGLFAQSEQDLLDVLFTRPMDVEAPAMVYPEIDSLKDLNVAYNQQFPFGTDTFYESYQLMTVSDVGFLADSLAFVDVFLDGRQARSLTYFKPANVTTKTAVFLVPGSGDNQAGPIYRNTFGNYHNYNANTESYRDMADVYVYIKPNEDILAIHKDGKKLDWYSLSAHLLSSGHSYASNYLTQCLGFIRALKGKYEKVILVGLSQGGLATMTLSLMSEPDGAVVSSGFTTLFYDDYYADLNQLIVPGLTEHFSKEKVYEIIDAGATYYLFTYGYDGDNTFYAIEAADSMTYKYLANTGKVSMSTANWGHSFPKIPVMRNFMTVNIERPLLKLTRVTDCASFADYIAISTRGELPVTFQFQREDDVVQTYTVTQAEDTLKSLKPGVYTFTDPTNSLRTSVYHASVTVRDFDAPLVGGLSIGGFQYDFESREWIKRVQWDPGLTVTFTDSAGDIFSMPGDEIKLPSGYYQSMSATVGGCPTQVELNLLLEKPYVSAYPNPVQDVLSIEVNVEPLYGSTVEAIVYDMAGRLEATFQLSYGKNDLDFSNMSPGIHIVRLQGTSGNVNSVFFKVHKI